MGSNLGSTSFYVIVKCMHFFKKNKIVLIVYVISCITLHSSCADPDIFTRVVSRSTDKVVTTFLLSSHQTIIQRESNCFSRWRGPYQETFNTTSRYFDDLLNIDNPYN